MTWPNLVAALRSDTGDYPSPAALARALEPRTIRTPALDILDQALVDAEDGTQPRLIFTMPPQEGKSYAVSRWFIAWCLVRNPDRRVALVSYSDDLARRWGRQVRNDIAAHPELALRVRSDTSAANEWQLAGHDGGMITAGIESSLTGRPVDLLVIDDPLKGRAEADSQTYRDGLRTWWSETGSTRLSEGAPVVLIQTRWHQDDLAGQRLTEDPQGWRLINIPAQAETDDDILGRTIGDYMISARGRTRAGWEQRKKDAGSRGWAAVYQGRPAPMEGNIFRREWWRTIPFPPMNDAAGRMHYPGLTEVIISLDATFKDTSKSDFVVAQVWGKQGAKARLLDQVRARLDFPATCTMLQQLCAKWPQAHMKLIEDKANGPAIIATLGKTVPGLIAVNPKDSKEARAHAIAPFIEAGNVELPDPSWAPWISDFVEECASFPNATHDDQVDAMTQALDRLLGLSSGLRTALDALHAERGGRQW